MALAKVKVVTGYIPIHNHPRSAEMYGELGEQLNELDAPLQPYYSLLGTCWMTHMIDRLPFIPSWSVADNPKKNSLAYHCVNHQKFEWLYQASRAEDDTDTYIWIDYGICSVPGVTPQIINEFLKKVKKNDLAIPGCWDPQGDAFDDAFVNWRFCGGVLVVPRRYVQELNNGIKAVALINAMQTKNITWEVNTLAHLERQHKVPIRWYKADHNEQLFRNYR